LAHGGGTVGPLLQATRTVPIVFPIIADPVGAGFVDTLARPGGNVTGFMNFEYGIGGIDPKRTLVASQLCHASRKHLSLHASGR
jgi:hypothetical protein